MGERRNWTEKETLIALALHYQIPFGKISSGNLLIQKAARKLNRTTAALVMKMGNLASFDKTLRARNVVGLRHGSKMDAEVWGKYATNYALLAEIYDQIRQQIDSAEPGFVMEDFPATGYNTKREVNERMGQNFFRNAVLSAYNYQCCVTGINVPQLLIASHIKPWAKSDDYTEKINPRNGLCLNALHNRAFDQGLITLDGQYRIVVSEVLKKDKKLDEMSKDWILAFEGKEINLPARSLPAKEFLEYHNDVIFQH